MDTTLSIINNLNSLSLLNQMTENTSSSSSLNSLLSNALSGTSLTSSSSTGQLSINLKTVGLLTAAGKLTDGNSLSVFSSTSTQDADTIVDAVTGFVTAFNSAVSALSGSSSSISSQSAESLVSLAEANSEALSAIGITIDDDGMLEVDSDILEEAAENNPEDIQAVFNDTNFITTVSSKARTAITQVLGLSSGAGFLSLYSSSLDSGLNGLLTSLYNSYL
ncbi:MAG TPA: flagellar filament capping protein FliD [bacterium]|nr:flagellar filament capping protein FliD [bacterium]